MERERLRLLRAVAPVKPLLEISRQRSREASEAEAAVAKALAEFDEAAASASAAEMQAAAEAAHRQALAEVKRFEPDWLRAASLDHEIGTARDALDKAVEEAAEARRVHVEHQTSLDGLARRRAETQRQHAATEAALQEAARHASFANAIEQVGRLVDKRRGCRTGASAVKAAVEIASHREALEGRIAQSESRIAEAHAERDRLRPRSPRGAAPYEAICVEELKARDHRLRASSDLDRAI